MYKLRSQAGFTLPELLIVGLCFIALAVLATWLLHPKTHAVESRNGQRWTAVAQLTRALKQYYVDHGSLPAGISAQAAEIGSEDDELDICPDLVPTYLKALPFDPQGGADLSPNGCTADAALYTTGYTVSKSSDGKLTVGAPGAEQGEKIILTIDVGR